MTQNNIFSHCRKVIRVFLSNFSCMQCTKVLQCDICCRKVGCKTRTINQSSKQKKNTKYVYMLATHCMVVVTLSGCLLCSDSPHPHPPQNPFPPSNRGLVLVVWIMFGRVVGADMALGHGWCTILLLLGNNEKLPPVALDHRRTTAMLSEERWLA